MDENAVVTAETPEIVEAPQAEAAAEPEESFQDFTRRRQDELSGKAAERRLDALVRAAEIADAILPLEEKLDSALRPRDEQGRFAAPVRITWKYPADQQPEVAAYQEAGEALGPMSDEEARLQQAKWEGRHQVVHENLSERLKTVAREEPELVAAAEKIELPAPLVDFIGHHLAELRNGEDVFRFLVNNPEQAAALKTMDGQGVFNLVNRISAGLEFGAASGQASELATTRAPRPPSPVGRASAGAAVDLSNPDISFKDFKKAREAQIKARRG